jgi:putative FmdB family regulatory protein
MPLYEYKCRSCGKTFELIQRFSDEPLTTHPECGGIVDKLLSAPAFHLKGTGWYATDYPKTAAKAAKTEDSKTETKSEKTESKSEPAATESKSESKSESKPAAESKPSPVT